MSGRRTLAFKTILLLVTALVLFVCAEGILRIKGDTYSWSEKFEGKFMSEYANYPCVDQWLLQEDHYYTHPEYNFAVNVNSLGIRDVEHTLKKDSSTYRVIGLGDSFTEGMGVAFENTWLSKLPEHYHPEVYDSVETICGGVRGSDPIFQYVLFKEKLLDYKPDAVVMVLNQGDVREYYLRGGFERFDPDSCKFQKAPAIEGLFRYSHVVRSFMLNILGYNWQLLSPKEQQYMNGRFFNDLEYIAQQMLELGQEKGFKFYIVFHPLTHELIYQHYDYDFKGFQERLKPMDVTVIDLYDTLNTITYQGDSLDIAYLHIDRHFNEYGYDLLSKYIADHLSE